MSMGDIYRIVNGYDDCGNVCGRINDFLDTATGCKVSELLCEQLVRFQTRNYGIYTHI